MSEVSALLSQLHPAGVEWVRLGDVGRFVRGKGMLKSDLKTQGFPAIHYGQVHATYWHATGKTVSYVDQDVARTLRKAQYGDVVLATTSEDDEGVARPVAWLGEGEIAVSSDAMIYTHEIDPGYASYFFESDSFQRQKNPYLTGTKVRRIRDVNLAKILIPLPALEIQREIAAILDQFIEIDQALADEIAGRERQYELARQALLDLDCDVTVKLGDIAAVRRGASPRPIQKFLTTDSEGVPWIKIGDVPVGGKYITQTAQRVTPAGAAKSRMVYPGDFVLSNSMSFGRPYITQIEGAIHDGWLSISEFEDWCNSDFLFYMLGSNMVQDQFLTIVGSGTVSNLNSTVVKSVEIPLPPLEIQEEIATKLDAFTEYIDLLKRERELRLKQYAHYRDLLFDFPTQD